MLYEKEFLFRVFYLIDLFEKLSLKYDIIIIRCDITSKIIILNGSSRKNGFTSSLVKSFIEGAESSGNEVREHFIHGMDINYCLGCDKCMETKEGCVQKKDEMNIIYEDLTWWMLSYSHHLNTGEHLPPN